MIFYVKGTVGSKAGTSYKKGILKAILRQQAAVFNLLVTH